MSLGNIVLVCVFGFLHSLSQKLRIFCGYLHIFLKCVTSSKYMSVFKLQDTWNNRTPNLGGFVPRLLIFFVKDFLTTYWWASSLETEKLLDSASSFGP